MNFRKIGAVLLFALCILIAQEAHATTSSTKKNPAMPTSSVNTGSFAQIKDIGKIIEEKTPNIIAKSLVFVVDVVEKFRSDMSFLSDNEKEKTQNQIKNFSQPQKFSSGSKNSETNIFLKIFKYAKLVFFTLLSFILKSKPLFYILSIIVVVLVVRWVLRIFFF